MQNLTLLELPADFRALIDEAADRAGVPARSPLLDGVAPPSTMGASNVVQFPRRRAASS